MTFLGLKMINFGHFSRFLASFKIKNLQLAGPSYDINLIWKTQNFRFEIAS